MGDAAGQASTLDVLSAAVASSRDAVGIAHAGKVMRVNQSFASLFGYDDPVELEGHTLESLTAPEFQSYVTQLNAGRAGGDHSTSVHRTKAQRRDGTLFDLETTGTLLQLDGVDYAFAICRDISGQRRIEDERRDREEFYRAMFEVNTAIKLLVDPRDGSIVDANPAAAAFYGWSLDQLRGMRISQINTLSEAEIARELEDARAKRRTAFHFRHRLADGRIRDVDVYSGPVMLRGRELLLSILHDVTERNQFEEQVRRSQRLDAVGQLAAGIAHDFNNLLTVVLASAQIAERQLPPENRVRTYLGDIRHAAQRGAELTRQLLAFARQQALAPSAIDLVATLGRIASMLERVLGDDIAVICDVPADLPQVRFDAGQLELALINVALNARDAMPLGGRLIIRAVEANADDVGPAVRVTIEDTGVGMDAETRARVFEPFFTTKPAGQGTGLGLATVYGIVSQSGGRVAIESAPGEGTHVHLWLPADPPAPAPRPPEPAQISPCAARSILIVDDRADVLQAIERSLGDVGLDVHTAIGAVAAMSHLDRLDGRIDVVLTDVAMPERSGVQLAADVHARWPTLPVVLMSGNAPASGWPPGVSAFLDKPFTLGDMIAVLDRVVPRRI
jgi:PAS domain S-box-containing protein